MEDCIFCKIIKKEIPSQIVFEDENMIIFKDINPAAPIHYLAVIKQHFASLFEMSSTQSALLGECLHKISLIKGALGLDEGYRLVINQGKNGGQTVNHLHVHILGGKKLNWKF